MTLGVRLAVVMKTDAPSGFTELMGGAGRVTCPRPVSGGRHAGRTPEPKLSLPLSAGPVQTPLSCSSPGVSAIFDS